ncbi:MAG: N-acetylmuramoyl-L-alanine amidase [Verrucomicrobia bacterium]|nr:N-acetylmuramoyl-L-alanine amidase [Verrucomicrobiota bacterium]MCH8526246.1 N-acetylmuramoyl-L-alanine amidase [Kiritimatiellia bacterium]
MQSRFYVLLALCALSLFPVSGIASGGRPSPRDPDAGIHASERGIPLRTFARTYGFQRMNETERTYEMRGQVFTLRGETGGRRVWLNDVMIWLNQPVLVRQGHWSFSEVDLEKTLRPILQPTRFLGGAGHQVVVLDPGHGGKDAGAVSAAGLTEKAVCLDISLRVRRHLSAAGYTVYLTRHQDQYLSLEERPRRAAAWNADVFVSIHANASTNISASGIETFVLAIPGEVSTNHSTQAQPSQLAHPGNAFDEANMALGFALQRSMLAATGAEDRGVRRARFSVLRDSPAPAALVEVGFLSNPAEAAKLAAAAHRERLAQSIAQGIDLYLREVRRAALLAADSPQRSFQP